MRRDSASLTRGGEVTIPARPPVTSCLWPAHAALAAGLLTAAVSGWAVTQLDKVGSVVVTSALAVRVLTFLSRRALTGPARAERTARLVPAQRPDWHAEKLRLPRFFYYLSVLFLGQLTFRLPFGLTTLRLLLSRLVPDRIGRRLVEPMANCTDKGPPQNYTRGVV
jgi:hypothetical protein